MFSTTIPVFLYIFAFILLTLPLAALFFIKRKYNFAFLRCLISGIAGYFLISSLLIPLVMSMLTALLSSGVSATEYWEPHHAAFLLTYSAITALLQAPLLYLVLKFVLHGNFRIYDCMAIGICYYYVPCMKLALSNVSYARVAIAYNKGTLESLVSDSVSLETLESSVADIQEGSLFIFGAQTINQIFLALSGVVILILLFHAVKTKKILFLLYAMLTIFGYLCVINFVEYFFGQIPVVIAIFLMIAGAVFFIWAYFRWYRGQQAELLRQRREYKEKMKSQPKA